MTKEPDRTTASSVTKRITALSRESGRDVQELMTIHALEGVLCRIALSEHRDDFVLKGGALLAAFAMRRPTRDVDLVATRMKNDMVDVTEKISKILGIEVQDGLEFDRVNLTAKTIRDGDIYSGVRVKVRGNLGKATVTVGIDVSFGDPIHPQAKDITLERLVDLEGQVFRILGYPLTMVLAEKLATALAFGSANTRWRDFADCYSVIGRHSLNAVELSQSLATVADYRGLTLVPLMPELKSLGIEGQAKWSVWRKRTGREPGLPDDLIEVITSLAAFTDPVIRGEALGVWDPLTKSWSAND